MHEWGFLYIVEYIEELANRRYYTILESATQTYSDRQISPKTALGGASLAEDQVEGSVSHLDSEMDHVPAL